MSVESAIAIKSPEHKRLRSGKKPPKDLVRRHLAFEMEAANQSPSTQTIDKQESFDSLDLTMQQLQAIAHADTSKNETTTHPTDTSDPESQYTASPPSQEEKDKNATPSFGRNSTS